MRKAAVAVMLVASVILLIAGYFFMAAPWGAQSVANSNPRVPYASLIVILGVFTAFSSAVVYELMPDRDDD